MQQAMEHQAWILRSFLAQLERQEAAGEEAPNGIAGEFARLKSQSTKYRTDKTYPTKTAEKQDNIKKNRYKDIVPFDHSRVTLTFTTSKNDSDYINASFIKGVSGSRAYIATQGPLPHTVIDFLRMLWEYNIKVVVMACREFELGKKKCECYWPQKQGQPLVCEPFTVYCDSEENKGDYLTRTLRVTYHNCSRTLKQLHYVTWPDHGVPDSIPPILEMLNEMRSNQAHDDTPICIHCSAGCGRTGALCVIDYTWNLLKKQMITPDFSIFELVQVMRTQRPSLVQTKEQYELVYKTIRLLFERHLQSMDAQAHRNEVTAVPSPIAADFKGKLSDMSKGLDILQQIQQVIDEDVSPQFPAPSPSASKNLIALIDKDTQRDEQQWRLLQTLPEAPVTTQEEEPQSVHTCPRAPAVEEDEDIPSLNPPPLPNIAAAMCMMVEDPYFDTPMSSPSSDEAPMDCTKYPVSPICSTPLLCLNDETLELNSPASGTVDTDEEVPPPLPQRTPESYVLAADADGPDPCKRLTVVIPSNAAAEAVRELRGSSPPSPVPPLPERTPESFELDIAQAPVEQTLQVTQAVNLSRIGMSSEWWGNSKQVASAYQNEMAPLSRSRSLKAQMTFTVAHADLESKTSNHHLYCPPWDPLTPPLLPKTEESLTPRLPDRTPESFALTAEDRQDEATLYPQPLQTAHPSPRTGLSYEWGGTSQPKEFLDIMTRSKSVRAKSSSTEPLTAAQQLTSPPVVMAEGGSAQVDVKRKPSLNTETPGNRSDKSHEKGMSRAKSLKFFRHKQKPKTAPPPSPTQPRTPPPSHSTSFSVFKFGFGNRFRKPKGPRSYPETWV